MTDVDSARLDRPEELIRADGLVVVNVDVIEIENYRGQLLGIGKDLREAIDNLIIMDPTRALPK